MAERPNLSEQFKDYAGLESRDFPLGDILSITTGKLVARDGIGAIYGILNFLTGDNLFTHQLPRAMRECRPHLAAQHPEIAILEAPDFPTPDSVGPWLAEQEARFGTFLKVSPLPIGAHQDIDPITEAIQMKGAENVLVAKKRIHDDMRKAMDDERKATL